jgi:hypothetical protein
MGKDGANMQCVDCHAGEDHRVRGRGADLSASDMPKKPLSCGTAECHGSAPHAVKSLNRHAERVACESCHIPTFARTDPTDMARDWSKPKYNPEKDKYGATITLAKDVTPVYAWWNGLSAATFLGETARTLSDGTVAMFVPQGDRSDPKARLFPFKLHKGRLPLLAGKEWLVPVNVEEFFADGKLNEAVKNAALATYGVKDATYGWRDTTRYMGIFHGVRPATKALACLDCHRPNGRLDWVGLGYPGDPLDNRAVPPSLPSRRAGRD